MAAAETWILSTVCLLALGGVAAMTRKSVRDAREDLKAKVDGVESSFDKLEKRTADDREKFDAEKSRFIDEYTHGLLCENQALTINKHLTAEIDTLKNETFAYLRSLEEKITEALRKP